MSAKGGDGSEVGGGGGAGGRLVMNYINNYLASSQPKQSFFWYGTMNILGGKNIEKDSHEKNYDLKS